MYRQLYPHELVPHAHHCTACGYDWSHTMFEARINEDWHYCPRCGAGPWTVKL